MTTSDDDPPGKLPTFDKLFKPFEDDESKRKSLILLTGNGFNLQFGFKTGYGQIFERIRNENQKDPLYKHCCEFFKKHNYDFEKVLEEIEAQQRRKKDKEILEIRKKVIEKAEIVADFIYALIEQVEISNPKGEEDAKAFLKKFEGRKFFTLNYDPLIYILNLALVPNVVKSKRASRGTPHQGEGQNGRDRDMIETIVEELQEEEVRKDFKKLKSLKDEKFSELPGPLRIQFVDKTDLIFTDLIVTKIIVADTIYTDLIVNERIIMARIVNKSPVNDPIVANRIVTDRIFAGRIGNDLIVISHIINDLVINDLVINENPVNDLMEKKDQRPLPTLNIGLTEKFSHGETQQGQGEGERLQKGFFDDGFGSKGNELIWTGPRKGAPPLFYEQSLFHIHGALHIYETEQKSEIKKITTIEGKSLLETIKFQFEHALNGCILKSTPEEKKDAIEESDYTSFCFKALKEAKGTLFIYGLSIAENDEHIWTAIDENKNIEKVYISLYKPKNFKDEAAKNKAIQDEKDLKKRIKCFFREKYKSGRVELFDSDLDLPAEPLA